MDRSPKRYIIPPRSGYYINSPKTEIVCFLGAGRVIFVINPHKCVYINHNRFLVSKFFWNLLYNRMTTKTFWIFWGFKVQNGSVFVSKCCLIFCILFRIYTIFVKIKIDIFALYFLYTIWDIISQLGYHNPFENWSKPV